MLRSQVQEEREDRARLASELERLKAGGDAALEKLSAILEKTNQESEDLRARMNKAEEEARDLRALLAQKDADFAELKARRDADFAELKARGEAEISELKSHLFQEKEAHSEILRVKENRIDDLERSLTSAHLSQAKSPGKTKGNYTIVTQIVFYVIFSNIKSTSKTFFFKFCKREVASKTCFLIFVDMKTLQKRVLIL